MIKKESKLIKRGNSLYVYIPADLGKNSRFPFKEGDKVQIEIKNDLIIVKKADRQTNNRQEKNERFLNGLTQNPEFVSKNMTKWVVITNGKLWGVLHSTEKVISELEGEDSPILIKKIGESKKRGKIQWMGGGKINEGKIKEK